MNRFDRAWLIVNASSGSNTPVALEELQTALGDRGIAVERRIDFPGDELPDPAALDAANVPLLVIYTGDGTLNAALARLGGWSGAVLVLPGGTMNLLQQAPSWRFPSA